VGVADGLELGCERSLLGERLLGASERAETARDAPARDPGSARVVLALPLRERQGEELERLAVRARVVTRPAHVVRNRRDPAPRRRIGRAAGEVHPALVPLPPKLRGLDDAEHVRRVDGERILAGRARDLPGREEARSSSSVPLGGVRHPAALEVDAGTAAGIVRAQHRLGVDECRVGLVEPLQEPPGARELRQALREKGTVALVPGPRDELREPALAALRVVEVPETVELGERDGRGITIHSGRPGVTRRYSGSSTSAATDSYASCAVSPTGSDQHASGVEKISPSSVPSQPARRTARTISAARPSGSGTAR